MIELNVRYHGEFALDNLGPCSMDEVFFPRAENSNNGIGSCYKIKPNGKVRFEDVNDICLDSSGKGSMRSPFSRRDEEFNLLLGALDFLHSTTSSNYDKTSSDFEHAKERVWEGFQIPNAQYFHPKYYADGTSVLDGDIRDKNVPSQFHENSHNEYQFNEYSDELHMKLRHPSSHCFVRAWGNDTSKIVSTHIPKHYATSKVVCKGNQF